MSFIPLQSLGPVFFSGGGIQFGKVDGFKRNLYVVEHDIPGREGGITENQGMPMQMYRLAGPFAPILDISNGPAVGVISGNTGGSIPSPIALDPEDAILWFQGVRGSGPQLVQIESTWSRVSGYPIMYENDFFWIKTSQIDIQAGRGYPYYAYTFDLVRSLSVPYGNPSGTTTFGNSGVYFSGYILATQMVSPNAPQGEVVCGLGVYVQTVASGHAQLAVYTLGLILLAATGSQNVHSGWNYFPINPTFSTISGTQYILAINGDVANTSGYTIGMTNFIGGGGRFSFQSGTNYNTGMPASLNPGTLLNVSGIALDIVMVCPR